METENLTYPIEKPRLKYLNHEIASMPKFYAKNWNYFRYVSCQESLMMIDGWCEMLLDNFFLFHNSTEIWNLNDFSQMCMWNECSNKTEYKHLFVSAFMVSLQHDINSDAPIHSQSQRNNQTQEWVQLLLALSCTVYIRKHRAYK